ncbi:hypothetical protein ACFXTI_031949 [Malus domestica]
MAETPVHPQDQNLNIPPQEATSAFPSWEVEFNALLSNTSGVAGHSAATTAPADSTALECKRLDSLGACLNDLGVDGQMNVEAVVQASSALDRVWESCNIF